MRHLVDTGFSRLFLSLLIIFSSLTLAAKTINVPAQQPTIQDGINAAANGDTVLVAPGTYFENINFDGKAITVKSSGGPVVTIIDGQQAGAVVSFVTGESNKSIVQGFILRNGSFGGVNIFDASPVISGNIITANCSDQGAIQNYQGAPQIEENLISDNLIGPECSGPFNAAISSIYDSGGEIIGNLIVGNGGGGIYLFSSPSTHTIQQNSILENSGPGINLFGAAAVLAQNLVVNNQGVGVTGVSTSTQLVNNTIAANLPAGCCDTSSEVYVSDMTSQVIMQNNLLVGTEGLPALYCQEYDSAPVFTNNDVFVNSIAAYGGLCPDLTGTEGNISADPLFVDLLSGNYHIQAASPAVNAGDNSALGLPKRDFDGDPRIVDKIVDIGADEYNLPTTLTLSSYSLRYAAVDVGSSSAPQTLTLSNNSNSAISIKLIGTGSGFSETNNCGLTLKAQSSCQISVTFSPLIGGTINGALGVFTSATLNPIAAALVGTGLAPAVTLSQTNLYFFGEVVGTTGTQTVTLTNSGLAPLLISSIVLSGATDFGESNNCPVAPSALSAGASCTLTVTYSPNIVTSSENASITINDNGLPGPQVIMLAGSSVSAGVAVLTPTSLTFPTTLIGQISPPQSMTLSNAGTGPLGVLSISTFFDFQETNNCPSSLAVNASCTITITYVPSVQGAESGFVEVQTDSANTFLEDPLFGTGSAPSPTITSLSLLSAPAGSGDTQVTITGTGFVNGSQVLWNGTALTNCCVFIFGSTQITFSIPAADLVSVGTYQLSVFTPAPGGGTSTSLPFTVYAPVNYADKTATYNYRSITGANLNLFYFQSAQITSPFPIQFGGGSYSNLTVGAGGTISFNGFSSESNDVIPTTQTSMLVAPFWANLYPFGSGTNNNDVFWEVIGTAPNRELVVEWRNVGICCETTNTIRFEVVFFEGSSNILFNYANTIFGGAYSSNDNGATATSGVQVAPGLGTQFSYDQPLILSKTSLLWYPNNPTATLSTSTLGFGYHQIDTPSLPQTLTLTNGGQVPLSISSVTTDNPDFVPTSGCGTTVAPGKTCVIRVVFTPSQPTAETATLTIADNAINSPQTVSLTGIGSITPVVVYPILVNFGSVAVGSSSTAPVTLANASNTTLSIQQIATDPSIFTQTNNCGTSLAPGLSCTVTVKFTPTQKGSIQGALAMGLNGKPTKIVSKLTGSGS